MINDAGANDDKDKDKDATSNKRKREENLICFDFVNKGRCSFGDACKYHHEAKGAQAKVCFEFKRNGSCHFVNCKFKHVYTGGADSESEGVPEKICFEFVNKGTCSHHDCKFKHITAEEHQAQNGGAMRPCFKFLQSGECPFNKACKFRHSGFTEKDYEMSDKMMQNKAMDKAAPGQRDPNLPFGFEQKKVCFEFVNKGWCKYGVKCTYSHDSHRVPAWNEDAYGGNPILPQRPLYGSYPYNVQQQAHMAPGPPANNMWPGQPIIPEPQAKYDSSSLNAWKEGYAQGFQQYITAKSAPYGHPTTYKNTNVPMTTQAAFGTIHGYTAPTTHSGTASNVGIPPAYTTTIPAPEPAPTAVATDGAHALWSAKPQMINQTFGTSTSYGTVDVGRTTKEWAPY